MILSEHEAWVEILHYAQNNRWELEEDFDGLCGLVAWMACEGVITPSLYREMTNRIKTRILELDSSATTDCYLCVPFIWENRIPFIKDFIKATKPKGKK